MDPVGISLEPADTEAPDFPLPHVFAGLRTETDDDFTEGDPDSADYLMGDWWAPKPSRPMHSTRCVATVKSTGLRCKRWAVIGFERCEKHSGYGRLANLKEYRERVLERARLDLLRAAPYAVESIAELARDTEINPAVRLKASETLLDRVGIKGGTEVDVTVKGVPEEDPTAVIRARLDRLAASAAAELESARPAAPAGEPEILDAEVVEDGD